jgi:hypothetical protein
MRSVGRFSRHGRTLRCDVFRRREPTRGSHRVGAPRAAHGARRR